MGFFDPLILLLIAAFFALGIWALIGLVRRTGDL